MQHHLDYIKLVQLDVTLIKVRTERLIHAFVMSRINNCNGLLYGLSDLLLGRLQRIQNSAARLVTRTRSHESISPILHTLHWLPVKDRLVFKLLIIAYKCQHHLAPHYLQQLLQEYQPSRLLRSSTKQWLTPHNVVTKSYGQRSFLIFNASSLESAPWWYQRMFITRSV